MLGSLIPGVGMGGGSDTTVLRRTVFRLAARRDVSVRRSASRRTTVPVAARRDTAARLETNSRMSITSNLTWFRGEDIVLDFQLTPAEDCTGWTISFKLADTLGGTVQFTKTATIVDGPRGKFRVTVASVDTASLTAGRFVWDARRTDSGNKATLADGYLDLRREVTA